MIEGPKNTLHFIALLTTATTFDKHNFGKLLVFDCFACPMRVFLVNADKIVSLEHYTDIMRDQLLSIQNGLISATKAIMLQNQTSC